MLLSRTRPHIYIIEVNVTTFSSAWVFDTACGTHIINNVQGQKNLAKGEDTL